MERHVIVCCLLVAIASLPDNQVGADPQTIPPPIPPYYTSNSPGGPTCPPGSKCLADGQASCVNGKCKCTPPNLGIGYHVCHRPNELYCAAFNDPTIKGWGGDITHAQLSCRFFLTDLEIPICDTSNPLDPVSDPSAGHCRIGVRAWGTRRLGKTFIKGSDLNFQIVYNGVTYNHFIRIWTTAVSGTFSFWQQVNGGAPFNLTIPGAGRIYTEFDTRGDNYGRVIAEMCGFEFGIRGVDFANPPRSETLSPGLYMKVNKDCDPEFPNSGSMLCGAPKGQGSSISDHADFLSEQTGRNVSDDMALMHLVLTDPSPQDFPGAASNLQQLMDNARACAEQTLGVFIDALYKCVFIMSDISFLRCFDKTENLETAIGAMDTCISSVCSSNLTLCADVQESILDSECKVKNGNDTILADDCGVDFDLGNITRPATPPVVPPAP